MNWLALDIGGANLKLADGKGFADSYALSLWKDNSRLARELRTLIYEAPSSDHLAVTMTGELADCFDNKSSGVQFILDAVHDAADGRHTRVYLTDGRIVAPQVAKSKPLLAASSNWHALARFVGRYAKQGAALLIDIGSTTSDLIPLVDGRPAAAGANDTDRLLSGELVYSGVERSPVCGLVNAVPYRGQTCPVAQEWFATSCDAYLVLGDLRENPTNSNTADGKPATKAAARTRLGRVICASSEQFNHRDAVAIAEEIAKTQVQRIAASARRVIDRMPSPPEKVVISGHGEFVARRVLGELGLSVPTISLGKELGADVSRCAPAHALAVLAREATEI